MKDRLSLKGLPKLGSRIKEKAKKGSAALIKARKEHELRQTGRYLQKTNVQTARAEYEEAKARTREAKARGKKQFSVSKALSGNKRKKSYGKLQWK